MHRGYTAERYLERLVAARASIEDLAVTTDLIVGFPGETEDDFERTLEVVAEAGYDSAYTFQFSPRPGTEAAAMVDEFIPADVVSRRFERLVAVVERSALLRHEARVGRTEEVVHFATPNPIRPGSYALVTVTGAAPHHLRGELVEVLAGPRHRTRIPVVAG
jgi:tRNA-2-methylthio-N6-dimethylallyladenosine synthase